MENLLSAEGVTVAGILLAAVVMLWRMNVTYSNRIQEDADKARQALIETLTASHNETQQLLQEQNNALEKQVGHLQKQCEEESEIRVKEWKEHYQSMEHITAEYRKSLESFNVSMGVVQEVLRGVQADLKEQTALLKEVAGVPYKIDKIQKDVDALWKHQHQTDIEDKALASDQIGP